MKKIFLFLVSLSCLYVFSGCNSSSKDSLSTDALKGRYQVDVSSLAEVLQNEIKGLNIPSAALSLVLSNIDVTIQFEGEKAIIDASSTAAEMLQGLTKNAFTLPMAVGYKIEKDSILFLQSENSSMKEVGVLKKVGDSYDYLTFIPKDKTKQVEVPLRRIK